MEKITVVLRPETKCLGEVEEGNYGHTVQCQPNDAAHNTDGKPEATKAHTKASA